MTKTIKISLSRAHKIAERITREIMSINTSLKELLEPVTINLPEEVKEIDVRLEKIKDLLTLRTELYLAQEELKVKIAQKNSQAGIPVLLNRRSVVQKQKEHISDILTSFNQQDVYSRATSKTSILKDKSLVKDYFERSEKANVMNSVKVSVVSDEILKTFESELNHVQNQLDNLSDEINTQNAKSNISLDLSEPVAAKIGL